MQILRFLFGVGRPFLRHEVAYGLADGHGFGFVQKLVLNVAVFQKRGNGSQYRQVVLLIIGRNQDAEKKSCAAIVGRVEHHRGFGSQDGNDDLVEPLNAAVRNRDAAPESRAAEALAGVEGVKGFPVGNAGIFSNKCASSSNARLRLGASTLSAMPSIVRSEATGFIQKEPTEKR